jgi:predicted CXXCH cytochrome family protein
MLVAEKLHAPFGSGSCDGCHRTPFGTRVRLRARGERLCAACHGDVAEADAPGATAHAALDNIDGRAGCLHCHEPHLSDHGSLLLEQGPVLCAPCHGAIVEAAGASGGHAPAGEDCTNCHVPHASAEAHLLTDPAAELCGMCHDLEDPDLAATHLGADPGALSCTSCHTPHGGEHPSLLARTLHPPVLDGCDTCHEGSFDQLMEGGGSELCVICHDDVAEAAAAAENPHPAMEIAACSDCHSPHASAQDHLIVEPAGGECIACHEDQAAGEGEVAHGVIASIGCRACHEPHGGANAKLLRKTGSELCLSCHQAGAVPMPQGATTVRLLDRFDVPVEAVLSMGTLVLRKGETGHPLQFHRTLGVPSEEELANTDATFDGELTCLTCHDPHKGRSGNLFNWNAASEPEVCEQCHKKL